jgi:hypothetical protein
MSTDREQFEREMRLAGADDVALGVNALPERFQPAYSDPSTAAKWVEWKMARENMIVARDEDELRASYKWLRDKIKAEVPNVAYIEQVFDCGLTYAVGVQKGVGEQRKRHAARVEYIQTVGGVWQELRDEDGSKCMGFGPPFDYVRYSLNDDPEKEQKVAEIIEKFRNL